VLREWIEHLEDLNYDGWNRNERTNGSKLRKERELKEGRTIERMEKERSEEYAGVCMDMITYMFVTLKGVRIGDWVYCTLTQPVAIFRK
jgi:hypothetical protein